MLETLLWSCVHVVSCCLATFVKGFEIAIADAQKRSVHLKELCRAFECMRDAMIWCKITGTMEFPVELHVAYTVLKMICNLTNFMWVADKHSILHAKAIKYSIVATMEKSVKVFVKLGKCEKKSFHKRFFVL